MSSVSIHKFTRLGHTSKTTLCPLTATEKQLQKSCSRKKALRICFLYKFATGHHRAAPGPSQCSGLGHFGPSGSSAAGEFTLAYFFMSKKSMF